MAVEEGEGAGITVSLISTTALKIHPILNGHNCANDKRGQRIKVRSIHWNFNGALSEHYQISSETEREVKVRLEEAACHQPKFT